MTCDSSTDSSWCLQAVRPPERSSTGPSVAGRPTQGASSGSRARSVSNNSQMPLSTSSGTLELETKLRLVAERQEPATEVGEDASPRSRMKHMHEQLDCFGPDDLLMGRFILLGQKERRTGGACTFDLLFSCTKFSPFFHRTQFTVYYNTKSRYPRLFRGIA